MQQPPAQVRVVDQPRRTNLQCTDVGDYRGFYEALKAVYGPTHQVQSPLRSADGEVLLTDTASILSCWSEHFQALFSTARVVQDSAILHISQLPVIVELDEPPSMKELTEAIEQTKSGKAAGVDGIPPEIWKDGGPALHRKLHELLVYCWKQGNIPRDLCDAVIVTLYKNKGGKSDCSNYRGITLLSILGKILARVLLNRLIPSIAENHLRENQCGFRANRGTTDMVFVLRQLQEKCREQNKGLYVTFVEGFRHSEQEGTLTHYGAPRLPPKVPQYDHPVARRPERPSQVAQHPLRTLLHRQRRETGLCPGSDSVQHLLRQYAQASYRRPRR